MGFKPWRNLSVLLIAGAALAGCNNTPEKDKSLGAGPKIGDPLVAKVPGPKFPEQSGGPRPFPTADKNPNLLLDNSPKSPWPATPGLSPNLNNPSFSPPIDPGLGARPINPTPTNTFPPLSTDLPPLGGGPALNNVSSPFTPPPTPASKNSGFGIERTTVPPTPDTFFPRPIDPPANFK